MAFLQGLLAEPVWTGSARSLPKANTDDRAPYCGTWLCGRGQNSGFDSRLYFLSSGWSWASYSVYLCLGCLFVK